MKRLVVIDGKSVFYRGYYAMGSLSTSDGTPTGGVYGFAAIAMELVRKLRPDKVVVAWDKAKTSIAKRKAIYPEYKAGRVKPPEDFFTQIPLLRELVEALGWYFCEIDEYEADDIIGTLAFQVSTGAAITAEPRRPYEMYIISSDLDMLQVVDENVKMYRLLKGFTELEEIDVKAVEEKYGIRKEQFLDLKALKGDASDNIPGVPGIGEKGAVKLLNEYGSLDGIYNNIEKITGATRKKLEAGKESAYMSYRLAKIMTDAPVELSQIPELTLDRDRIVEALDRLEFKSLKRKFLSGSMAFDTTHSASSADALLTRRMSNTSRSATPASSHNAPSEKPELLDGLPEGVIFSFDIKGLMHRDAEVAKKILGGVEFYDLGQGKFLLNPLARKNVEEQGSLFGDDPEEMRAEYVRQQAEFEKYPKLKRVFYQLDMPLIPVLYKIEQNGMKIDREYFRRLQAEYEAEVGRLTREVYELAGTEFNLNSPIQLGEVLFEKLGLPTKGIKKTLRGYSTGAKELEKLKGLHPIIPKLMEYREAAKLLNTYIVPLPQLMDGEGRVHTTFTQDVTATGRLSSVNPNLQNIPTRTEAGKKIRGGFVAEPGKVMISADYAQFELRLAAAMSGDEALVKDFNEGVDIHTKTAAEVYGIPMSEVTKDQRREAKVVNFGIIYGMSAKGLADATGMTVAEAQEFERQYFELRKPIETKLKSYLEQARTEGFVETWFGRRRPTPDVKSANFVVRTGAERAAQNMPIQGTEADLMKLAMIRLNEKLPEGAEMIMQVHDSIMVECEPGQAEEVGQIMREVMEGVAPELGVKLAVDVKTGKNWGEV
ncbi:DNA polymerase I [Candidatus Saccharibacteria bacterium]|nr:DNA polymerase I [Candidatus Saccharibacteria bacterium]